MRYICIEEHMMYMYIFMPQDRMIEGKLFLSGLFVSLSVCLLSNLIFAITLDL